MRSKITMILIVCLCSLVACAESGIHNNEENLILSDESTNPQEISAFNDVAIEDLEEVISDYIDLCSDQIYDVDNFLVETQEAILNGEYSEENIVMLKQFIEGNYEDAFTLDSEKVNERTLMLITYNMSEFAKNDLDNMTKVLNALTYSEGSIDYYNSNQYEYLKLFVDYAKKARDDANMRLYENGFEGNYSALIIQSNKAIELEVLLTSVREVIVFHKSSFNSLYGNFNIGTKQSNRGTVPFTQNDPFVFSGIIIEELSLTEDNYHLESRYLVNTPRLQNASVITDSRVIGLYTHKIWDSLGKVHWEFMRDESEIEKEDSGNEIVEKNNETIFLLFGDSYHELRIENSISVIGDGCSDPETYLKMHEIREKGLNTIYYEWPLNSGGFDQSSDFIELSADEIVNSLYIESNTTFSKEEVIKQVTQILGGSDINNYFEMSLEEQSLYLYSLRMVNNYINNKEVFIGDSFLASWSIKP